jgi:cytidyltransferase-like protein
VKKFKKAFVGGTFDMFHVGHQFFLMQALCIAEKLVIIVARDQTVLQIKGHIPHFHELHRLQRIKDEKMSRVSVRLGRKDGDFLQTLREETPDLLMIGYDQKIDTELFSKKFPNITIITAQEYYPKIFKSSRFITF